MLWAENFPSIEKIVAVDSNPAAVANAARNTAGYGERITVLQSNLFEAFESKNTRLMKLTDGKMFDAIIFNGPHLDTGEERRNAEVADRLTEKYGPAAVTDLCDFGLTVAERFFAEAGKYLAPDGFIIYTFSDYCKIERLFKVIADSRFTAEDGRQQTYLATLLSVMEFSSRDLEEFELRRQRVRLWYNLKIKRKGHLQLSELTRGFRKAIVKLSAYYAMKRRADTAHIKEHRDKTESLLKCLAGQIDQLLDPCGWLISGFSLADWNRKKSDQKAEHTLLYSFGADIIRAKAEAHARELEKRRREAEKREASGKGERPPEAEQPSHDAGGDGFDPHETLRRDLDSKTNRLLKFMRDMPSFVPIIDYLADPKAPRVIEAHVSNRNRSDYLEGVNKLTYEFDSKGLYHGLDLVEDPTPAQTFDIQQKSASIDADIRSPAALRRVDDENLLRIAHNLWLNLSAIRPEGGREMLHIKFTKIDYPMVGLSGSVYFFSALEPTQENNEMLASLEEVIGIANDNLLNPIWASIRHEYALRSAIAAIMSRNMSHNLGSHVLWHLSQKLEHMADELEQSPAGGGF
jgi:SAM-dependent methyltransferase